MCKLLRAILAQRMHTTCLQVPPGCKMLPLCMAALSVKRTSSFGRRGVEWCCLLQCLLLLPALLDVQPALYMPCGQSSIAISLDAFKGQIMYRFSWRWTNMPALCTCYPALCDWWWPSAAQALSGCCHSRVVVQALCIVLKLIWCLLQQVYQPMGMATPVVGSSSTAVKMRSRLALGLRVAHTHTTRLPRIWVDLKA